MNHPLASVHSNNIGKNTTIWQFAVILEGAQIGTNCNINCHTFIENDVIIGDNVTIKAGVYLWDGIRIEKNVFIGPNVTFNNDRAPRSKQYPNEFLKTLVRCNSSIGSAANILGGVEIGEYAMIGAGAIVTKNVPRFQLWYGVPAVHKGYVTRGGEILSLDLTDKFGNKFKLINGEPIAND